MEKQRKIEEAKRLAEEEARQKMEKELVSQKYRLRNAKRKISDQKLLVFPIDFEIVLNLAFPIR